MSNQPCAWGYKFGLLMLLVYDVLSTYTLTCTDLGGCEKASHSFIINIRLIMFYSNLFDFVC